MSELRSIERDIVALKKLLGLSWQTLATSGLTSHERRECRNEMNKAAADLRHHLQSLETEHNSRKRAAKEQAKRDAQSVELRFVFRDYRADLSPVDRSTRLHHLLSCDKLSG